MDKLVGTSSRALCEGRSLPATDKDYKKMAAADPTSRNKAMLEDVASILKDFGKGRENLLPILQKIQERHGYLAMDALVLAAEHMKITPGDVYGVASFYNQFRFDPPGRHRIKICTGTACHVAGSDFIVEQFERRLGIKNGETSPDREFSLENVVCIGCCALAPVAVVDEEAYGNLAPGKIKGLLSALKDGKDRESLLRCERVTPAAGETSEGKTKL